MLSNTSKYAIRASIYLALYAGKDKRVDIKEIAKTLKIPSSFLSKILQNLARQKILSSTKGPNGGFGLAHIPERISLYDIIKITEGEDFFSFCVLSMENCGEKGKQCPVHNKYLKIREELISVFKKESLADLIKEIKNNEKIVI